MIRKLNTKAMIAFAIMAFFIGILFMIPSAADNVGNFEPDGGVEELYAPNVEEYNRTINVTCRDQTGRILKQVTCHTTYENNPLTPSGGLRGFVIGIYGYDITDFETDAGVFQTCKLSASSGTPLCTTAIIQFDYKFYTAISGKSINVEVKLKKTSPLRVTIGHYTMDTNEKLICLSSDIQVIEYGDCVSWIARCPIGYQLADGFINELTGSFSYSWVNSCANLAERVNYDLVYTGNNKERTEYHESKHGSLKYCTNRELTVSFVYVLQTYSVDFNPMDGYGGPSRLIKYYDVDLTIPSEKPEKDGYVFVGWNTSPGKITPNYLPGSIYKQNRSVTMYAIWRSDSHSDNTGTYYTVSYDANGGENAPEPQYKYDGQLLILSGQKPARKGYTFMGWSPNPSATIPTYSVEDIYERDESCMLYAVWKEDFDYALSDLTVSPSVTPRSTPVTVTCIITSDSPDRYAGIPVSVYVDGEPVKTVYIDCREDGIGEVTVILDSGVILGDHTVRVVIDESALANERDRHNSTVEGVFTVTDDTDLSFETGSTEGNGGTHYAGQTVVTSFTVRNAGRYDMIPASGVTAAFRAYYENDDGEPVVLTQQTWSPLVIPSEDTNLVYFKWTVPAELAGKEVWVVCSLVADGFDEVYTGNNTISYSIPVYAYPSYHTPDTRFESAPAGYRPNASVSAVTQQAIWSEWAYEDGTFVRHTYGVRVTTTKPVATPDTACPSAFKRSAKWVMPSGYGITLTYSAGVMKVSGCEQAPASSYTPVQSVTALYPEYNYVYANGKCDTLERAGNVFRLAANPDAHGNSRLHFIPVYVADGRYTVAVRADGVWTPVGVIYAQRLANEITIEGTVYDDWYHG